MEMHSKVKVYLWDSITPCSRPLPVRTRDTVVFDEVGLVLTMNTITVAFHQMVENEP